jgi:hypothetical protein
MVIREQLKTNGRATSVAAQPGVRLLHGDIGGVIG